MTVTTHALAVDIGGTFTDVTLVGPNGDAFTKKILTTTDDLVRGCVEGITAVLALGVPFALTWVGRRISQRRG